MILDLAFAGLGILQALSSIYCMTLNESPSFSFFFSSWEDYESSLFVEQDIWCLLLHVYF